MKFRIIPLVLILMMAASLVSGTVIELENIADDVVNKYMTEKNIPGMSVAVIHNKRLVFSKGYGLASIEFDVLADADTVYPISSVTKMISGLLAMRLANEGMLDLDSSLSEHLDSVPSDKRAITVRQLLQHTHGLEDFYRSDSYELQTGQSVADSTTQELIEWSLTQPLRSPPGENWDYSLTGYVLLGHIFEMAGGSSYADLVEEFVFAPLGMSGSFGGSGVVVPGRNPILYELAENDVTGHVVDFPERVWPAGGLNMSVNELARLFVAISEDEFLDHDAKQEMWHYDRLPGGKSTNYGLGWMSYETSQKRWVVGHEGGGASWVIYYPDLDLAVIALSNMSGARADALPYEIARAALDNDLIDN